MKSPEEQATENLREQYPGLERRYFATIVDFFTIVFIIIATLRILEGLDVHTETARKWAILAPVFIYEAFLTSTFGTLGQHLFRFRVRRFRKGDPEIRLKRINIVQAYIRLFLKYLLGALSCLTMPANPQRRALHDLTVGSVVIGTKQLAELQLEHGS
jgi:uncharacterized RDD family membrane protein YckC